MKKSFIIKCAIFAVMLIVAFAAYPRKELYQFAVEVGEFWRYESLQAPFDFAIYKDPAVIESEIRNVRYSTEPYFREISDANGKMLAKRDTVRNQLDRLLEAHMQYSRNLARDSLEWAYQDSLLVADLKRTFMASVNG